MITVVIPYYQKSPGILQRALASIASQRDCALPLHVIVVDDASPVSADDELRRAGTLPFTVRAIRQENGGPGAARNTGLDNAPESTRYIAFLDSDDEWTPDHLARAVAALQSGYDFYFSDLYQLDQQVGAFARAGRIDPSQHPALNVPYPDLHAYRGDLLDQTIRANIIGTPTVVYDFQRFKDKRFKVEFRNAGEDYLFWMDLAYSGAKVAFSNQCEVRCGRGVNVYAGSGWGSEQHLARISNEIRYKKLTAQLFPLNAAQKSHINASLQTLRMSFARDLIHRVAHRKRLPMKLLAQHAGMDMASYLGMPWAIVKLVLKK
jgi:succinoglycan biosynthesis protein ExoW